VIFLFAGSNNDVHSHSQTDDVQKISIQA